MSFLFMEEVERGAAPLSCGKEDGKVVEIEATKILPNPAQPRRSFDEEALAALAESVRRFGILQPPVVRPLGDGTYELIAGERRLRAALLAGKTSIPCLLREGDGEESAALAIVENLLREDLDLFEEAQAISSLLHRYALTQAEVGRRLSVSQPYIANKLRLLQLSEEERKIAKEGNLTERHLRAALRLPPLLRKEALCKMARAEMKVAEAENYVTRLLEAQTTPAEKPKPHGVIKDIRLFYNSLDRAVSTVKSAGIGIDSTREEDDREIRIRIAIKKPS